MQQAAPSPLGYFVVEYQHPRAGMSWYLFPTVDSRRLEIGREVVRVERWRPDPSMWSFRHSGGFWVSGPLVEFNLTDMIVGRVVGIYRP